jgi:hypothetical protein
MPAMHKNRLVGGVIDDLQDSLDHFRTRVFDDWQMDKLDAMSVREFPFGLRLRLPDLLKAKEVHNGSYPIPLFHLLESGYRRKTTAE